MNMEDRNSASLARLSRDGRNGVLRKYQGSVSQDPGAMTIVLLLHTGVDGRVERKRDLGDILDSPRSIFLFRIGRRNYMLYEWTGVYSTFVPGRCLAVTSRTPTNSNLEMLPPELLAHVFSLACTDGGATACAIRASSSTFNTLLDPFRFRSISVRGPRQLAQLLGQLSSWMFDEHGQHQPHREVRHLSVYDMERCPNSDAFSAVKNMIHTFVSWASCWNQPEAILCTPTDDPIPFDDLLIRLTSLCAHSLVTYSAVFTDPSIDTPISWLSSTNYPHLNTLSIEYHSEHGLQQPPPESRPSLPALQNLHINASHFLDAGPLAIVMPTTGPIQHISFRGPADSFILEYALERFKAGRDAPCAQAHLACRDLQLVLTAAPADLTSSYRSVAAKQLLEQLAATSPDGVGLLVVS